MKESITLLLSLVVVSNEALQVGILIFFTFFGNQLLKAIKVVLNNSYIMIMM